MREGSHKTLFFDDLFGVTLCGILYHVLRFSALLCCFMREASRIERGQTMVFVVLSATQSSENQTEAINGRW